MNLLLVFSLVAPLIYSPCFESSPLVEIPCLVFSLWSRKLFHEMFQTNFLKKIANSTLGGLKFKLIDNSAIVNKMEKINVL